MAVSLKAKPIRQAYPVSGYSCAELREIRSKKGVGRPPKLEVKVSLPKGKPRSLVPSVPLKKTTEKVQRFWFF